MVQNKDNDLLLIPSPLPNYKDKILISGRVISDLEYEKLTKITEADIVAIAEDWQKQFASSPYKNLLDAD